MRKETMSPNPMGFWFLREIFIVSSKLKINWPLTSLPVAKLMQDK